MRNQREEELIRVINEEELNIRKNVAKNLRRLRKQSGLTIEELAKKLDTSKSNISSWENMKYLPSVPMAFRICKLFNVALEQIYGVKDDLLKHYTAIPLIQEFLKRLDVDINRLDNLTDEQVNALKVIIKNFLDKQSNN